MTGQNSYIVKEKPIESLTVDNHADGPYVYLRMLKDDPDKAANVLELLKMNEGNSSGKRDWMCKLGWFSTPRPVLETKKTWAMFEKESSAKFGQIHQMNL